MSTPGQWFRAVTAMFLRQRPGDVAGLAGRASAVLAVAGLLYAIHLGAEFRESNRVLASQAAVLARATGNEGRDRIDEALRRVAGSVEELSAGLLADRHPDESELLGAIRGLLYANPDLAEAGIAFKPFSYDPRLRLFGLSYTVGEQGIRFRDLDVDQDYTNAGVDWYHRALTGSPAWLEPRHHERVGRTVATYAAPIPDPSDPSQTNGVVYARFAVDRLQQVLDGLNLGENGYSLLLSRSGRFVLHPNRDYVDDELTMDAFLRRLPDTATVRAIESAFGDPARDARFNDPSTGLDARILFRSIPTTQWTLGVVVVDRDTLMPPATAHRKLTDIALVVGISLVLLAVPLAGAARGSTPGIWIVSSIFAGVCIVITGFVLWLAQGQPPPRATDSVRITNQNSLDHFMSEQRRRTLGQRDDIPLFIPTGIHIRSISFEAGDEARVTGYVWQRYTAGIHDDVERGFVMPESRSFDVGEPHVTRTGDSTLVRWNFKSTLDRQFDYSRYPFGREYLRIQLWNKEFTANVILVPDLASYKLTNPAAAPGLSADLLVSGWNIEDSFFSYRFQSYESSFGLADYSGLTDFPELFFNVGVEKQITGIVIANLIPLTVVFVLLFGVLFLATNEGDRHGRLAFTLDVVLACAAFFLVAIFSHIAMRNSVPARDIFYLEYYYFVAYVMILFVAMDYVHMTKTPIALLRFGDNLIAKVIYWPITLAAILVLTLVEFY